MNAWSFRFPSTGVWLILMVGDQVAPPLVDIANATAERPVKRRSCQTTYRLPLAASTATSGRMLSVRCGWPVSGSITSATKWWSMIRAFRDHVSPRSVERMNAMLNPRDPGGAFLAPWIRSKKSIRSPLGSTTIWLPIVWSIVPGSKIFRAGSQLSPPSVVRLNHAGPRKATLFSNALGGALSPGGDTSRSHTAYTKSESCGSAVRLFLSLSTFGFSSRLSVMGSLHVTPPSVDRITSMAFGYVPNPPGFVSTDRLIRYMSPLGATSTQGSDAR